MKRTRLRPVNPARRAKLYERNFGQHAQWIREQSCLVCASYYIKQTGPTVAHHARSRGAGGDRSHLVPLCQMHHQMLHDGNLTWPGRDELLVIAEVLWKRSPHREVAA